MKRLFVLLFVLLFVPVTFFAGAAWSHHRARQHANYELNAQLEKLRRLQGAIYGPSHLHWRGESNREGIEQLDAYDPVTMGGSIKISYVGGYRDVSENYVELLGSGDLYSGVDGKRKLVTTIAPERCREIFLRNLSTGILNYSDDVIRVKEDLIQNEVSFSATCMATTRIEIIAEKLGISKEIEVYGPNLERKNHPHIIEYKLVANLEDEIRALVPAGFPLWK